LKTRVEWSFFDDLEEIASAIEEALADINLGQGVTVYYEWIRRSRQCIDGGEHL
jgi:hypothetical protein